MQPTTLQPATSIRRIIGTVLHVNRTLLGVSQRDAALVLDITQSAYSKLERGINQLRVEQLFTLAPLFGLSPAELVALSCDAKSQCLLNGIAVLTNIELLQANDRLLLMTSKQLLALVRPKDPVVSCLDDWTKDLRIGGSEIDAHDGRKPS